MQARRRQISAERGEEEREEGGGHGGTATQKQRSSAQFHEEVLARWLRGVPRYDIHLSSPRAATETPWGNSPGVRRESLNQKW